MTGFAGLLLRAVSVCNNRLVVPCDETMKPSRAARRTTTTVVRASQQHVRIKQQPRRKFNGDSIGAFLLLTGTNKDNNARRNSPLKMKAGLVELGEVDSYVEQEDHHSRFLHEVRAAQVEHIGSTPRVDSTLV